MLKSSYPEKRVVNCYYSARPDEGQTELEVVHISTFVRVNVRKIKTSLGFTYEIVEVSPDFTNCL